MFFIHVEVNHSYFMRNFVSKTPSLEADYVCSLALRSIHHWNSNTLEVVSALLIGVCHIQSGSFLLANIDPEEGNRPNAIIV